MHFEVFMLLYADFDIVINGTVIKWIAVCCLNRHVKKAMYFYDKNLRLKVTFSVNICHVVFVMLEPLCHEPKRIFRVELQRKKKTK